MRLARLVLQLKAGKVDLSRPAYLTLAQAPLGPLRQPTAEERERVNLVVDRRLQELEDSGLSREELLFEEAERGLPLALDPFFQYIKNNRLAREIYLRAGEDFTVEKVVDIALRQDIGPDPSYSRNRGQKAAQAHRVLTNRPFDNLETDTRKGLDLFSAKNYYSEETNSALQDIRE
jgi:hypothetical protein